MKEFNWDERVREAENPETALVPVEPQDDLTKDLNTLIGHVCGSLVSHFKRDEDGNIQVDFPIAEAKDFKAFVAALKDLLYIRAELSRDKGKKDDKPSMLAKTVNMYFDGMDKKGQLDFMSGKEVDVTNLEDPSRGVEGRAEEADYTEVSEDTGKDGHGCDVIDHGDGESDTGDEGKL